MCEVPWFTAVDAVLLGVVAVLVFMFLRERGRVMAVSELVKVLVTNEKARNDAVAMWEKFKTMHMEVRL